MEPNQELNTQTGSLEQGSISGANIGQNGEMTNDLKPSTDAIVQDTPVKKNNKTGIILGFVLLALIAAGGVGFGVWAMMDGDAQREQLNKQINALKEQNDRLSEQISDTTKTDDNPDSKQKPVDEGNDNDDTKIVAINEWGINVLFPEGFGEINYEYKSVDDTYYCDSYIAITSVKKDGVLVESEELGGLAFLRRCSDFFPYGHMIYDDGDKQYYYESPNGGSIYDSQLVQDVINDFRHYFRSDKTLVVKP